MTEPRRPRPVVQLTLMRLREMMREPGALFWTFGFPVLLSVALGIAFRVKGPDPVVAGALPGVSAQVRDALAAGGVQVRGLDEAAAKAAPLEILLDHAMSFKGSRAFVLCDEGGNADRGGSAGTHVANEEVAGDTGLQHTLY